LETVSLHVKTRLSILGKGRNESIYTMNPLKIFPPIKHLSGGLSLLNLQLAITQLQLSRAKWSGHWAWPCEEMNGHDNWWNSKSCISSGIRYHQFSSAPKPSKIFTLLVKRPKQNFSHFSQSHVQRVQWWFFHNVGTVLALLPSLFTLMLHSRLQLGGRVLLPSKFGEARKTPAFATTSWSYTCHDEPVILTSAADYSSTLWSDFTTGMAWGHKTFSKMP